MNLQCFDHIAIIGSNYENSRHFYVDLLGFPLIREIIREDRGDRILTLQFGNGEIELFIKPDAPARPTNPEAQGLRHLAFRVESVEEAVRELAERGVSAEPIRIDPQTNGRYTFFFDPDGLPLELHE